ncbi:MAG TPA: cyclic-di-AMP receptor [Verrucomicrobiae bacterium]|nr:cyclic-di-AMP receptor [Verrucomicrobiae bacterium]
MKLVVAIVHDNDSARLVRSLVKGGFSSTKLASTGGFLREGNTTLLLGVEDEKVNQVVEIIRLVCKPRNQIISPVSPGSGPVDSYLPSPVEIQVGGATVFVLQVEQTIKV